METQISTARTHQQSSNHRSSNVIVGNIRINSKNYTDAFISDPNGGPDIHIKGHDSRGMALDGDVVAVELNDPMKWVIDYNVIIDRWNEWSINLEPILLRLRNESAKADILNGSARSANAKLDNQSSQSNSTRRSKRDTSLAENDVNAAEGTSESRNKPNVKSAISLPSNLPREISELQVEHLIGLPFSDFCIRKTGFVIELIKKNHSGISGGFLKKFSDAKALFSPTDSRVPRMLIDINECPIDFSTQPSRYKDILFVARLIDWDGLKNYAVGTILRIVGDRNSVQSRMDVLLEEHQIFDQDFPQDVYQELSYLDHLPNNWFELNSKNRLDFTKECVFTIDPKTARDLDDAVSIKQVAEQIYQIGVHIADVSHFVRELSAVDYHARMRTTSVYLVDRVIPMLPRILCERMCSLNPGEPKLTFSVIWKMDKYGHIKDVWFGKTLIKSCTKLSYEQAQDLIDRPYDISWIRENVNMPELRGFDWKQISKSVVMLNKIAKNMRTKRFQEGALKIDQAKIKFELDQDSGLPLGFSLESRTDANFLIEEYMLLANMSVAERIHKHFREATFLRRHPPSSPRLMEDVKRFCDAKGIDLDISSSGSIQRSLNTICDPTTSKVVSHLLLRAMKNAEYVCVGSLPLEDMSFRHFALNTEFYTHFTSPIRRYADIVVHRQLSIALDLERDYNEEISSLTRVAEECTKRKISSKLISDQSQKLYFNAFVRKAGSCDLLACVTRILDQSFDVILVDFDRIGRVYLNRLQAHLSNVKFESFAGIKRLVLDWNESLVAKSSKKKKKKGTNGVMPTEEQLGARSNLDVGRSVRAGNPLPVKKAINGRQEIEVFDVVWVTVSVDEKDITQLKIDLKIPVE